MLEQRDITSHSTITNWTPSCILAQCWMLELSGIGEIRPESSKAIHLHLDAKIMKSEPR